MAPLLVLSIVPPVMVNAPVPRAVALLIFKVPAARVRLPLHVLAPLNVMMPAFRGSVQGQSAAAGDDTRNRQSVYGPDDSATGPDHEAAIVTEGDTRAQRSEQTIRLKTASS